MTTEKIDNTKKVLRKYKDACEMVKEMERQIDEMSRSISLIHSPQFSGMPRGGVPVTFADKVGELDVLKRRKKKFEEVAEQQREIVQKYIDSVMSPRHNWMLTLYFINNMTFEEIAEKRSYSVRQIFRIYAEALEMVDLSINL